LTRSIAAGNNRPSNIIKLTICVLLFTADVAHAETVSVLGDAASGVSSTNTRSSRNG
jgi:hypothetical protein